MIFCFSATGNSLYAAEKLREALGDDLVDIPRALRRRESAYRVQEGEQVGFVFPVYFYGVPTIVREFLSGLALEGNRRPYIYLVLTCGGDPGLADRRFARLLAKRGLALDASFTLPMVDNYVILYDVHTLEQQQDQLAAADRELEGIIRDVAAGRAGGLSYGLKPWAKTAFMYPLYNLGRRTRKFHALDTCTGCGLCEDICPCGAIKRSGSGPEWVEKRCVHCLGCINRCPVEAIQYGRGTKKRRRYVHSMLRRRDEAQVDAQPPVG